MGGGSGAEFSSSNGGRFSFVRSSLVNSTGPALRVVNRLKGASPLGRIADAAAIADIPAARASALILFVDTIAAMAFRTRWDARSRSVGSRRRWFDGHDELPTH